MSKNPRITSEEVGIIKKAQAGDMRAFNTLFYKYKGFVESILLGYIGDEDEAKRSIRCSRTRSWDSRASKK